MVKQMACAFLVALATAAPASAATISFDVGAPILVGSSFDVDVLVDNVFDGRNAGDTLLAFGFDVTIGNPAIVQFASAAGGALFDPVFVSASTPMVVGFAIDPFAGIAPGDFVGPLLLATLRFDVLAAGTTTIGILGNTFPDTGMVFFEEPFEDIAGTTSVTAVASTAVPEPASLVLLGGGLAGLVARRRRRS